MSAATRRTRVVTDAPAAPPVFDLGGRALTKGTTVRATTVGGDCIRGSLIDVTYRDGVAHTVAVWVENHGTRYAYVSTVTPAE